MNKTYSQSGSDPECCTSSNPGTEEQFIRKQVVTLTPTVGSPSDMLNKLERERYRAFHSRHAVSKADHLYNFCVTALALRDYVFRELHWDKQQEQAFHEHWNQTPERVACSEIGNVLKHRQLRKGKLDTKAMEAGTSSVVEIWDYPEANRFQTIQKDGIPDWNIVLANGNTMQVWEFTDAILKFWHNFFAEHAIPYTKQDTDILLNS